MASLTYLSHGNAESGGHNHERFLASKIALSLNLSIDVLHKAGVFTGLLGHLKLWFWAFLQPKGKLIIAQDRLIIPVLLSTLFFFCSYSVILDFYACELERTSCNFISNFLFSSCIWREKFLFYWSKEFYNFLTSLLVFDCDYLLNF